MVGQQVVGQRQAITSGYRLWRRGQPWLVHTSNRWPCARCQHSGSVARLDDIVPSLAGSGQQRDSQARPAVGQAMGLWLTGYGAATGCLDRTLAPHSFFKRNMIASTNPREEASNMDTGSSATMSRGWVKKARAIIIRCRWPPLSSCCSATRKL